jgi:hypothetical protein
MHKNKKNALFTNKTCLFCGEFWGLGGRDERRERAKKDLIFHICKYFIFRPFSVP